MTLTQLRTIIRDLTKTQLSSADGGSVSGGDANFTDTTINLYLTNAAHLLATEVVEANDDWDFQGEYATTDLVANQREYKFPTDILKIKRVEAMFDGTNWKRIMPINEQGIADPIGNETSITNVFDNNFNCYFADLEKSIFIYSGTISSVSAGLKIWYTKEVVGKDASNNDITAFATTTDVPNLAAAFQEALCYYTAMKYFTGFQDFMNAAQMEKNFEKLVTRLRTQYAQRIEARGLRIKGSGDLANYE